MYLATPLTLPSRHFVGSNWTACLPARNGGTSGRSIARSASYILPLKASMSSPFFIFAFANTALPYFSVFIISTLLFFIFLLYIIFVFKDNLEEKIRLFKTPMVAL